MGDQLRLGKGGAEGVQQRVVIVARAQSPPAFRGNGAQEQVPQQAGELPQKRGRVLSLLPEPPEALHGPAAVVPGDVPQQRRDLPVARQPQGAVDRVGVDVGASGALVQHTQRVAHPALAEPRQQRRRLVRQAQPLLGGHIAQPVHDDPGVQPLEGVALAAGEDGGRDLLQLRGGQDEHQMLRRLLQNLQQGVEGGGGEHMHLVDDVDPLFRHGGGEQGLVPKLAHAVHAVVAGRVQLHHVGHAAVVDAPAEAAGVAGTAVHRLDAVHGLGQDAGAGGLPGAPGAHEEIGVAQVPGDDLLLEGLRDVGLSHDLVKGPGTPFSIKRLIHGDTSRRKRGKAGKSDSVPRRGGGLGQNTILGETAHPSLREMIHPLQRQPTRLRHPRGTRSDPLSAARFPA